MHHWTRRLFALAAPLLLTGCLWGPGKFTSDLTLRKDGSFVLDYRGEMVLQLPPDTQPKTQSLGGTTALCHKSGTIDETIPGEQASVVDKDDPVRPCTAAEI